MEMQIQLKYGLAEKFSPIGVSACRKVFPGTVAYKKLCINLISNRFADHVLAGRGLVVWNGGKETGFRCPNYFEGEGKR